MPNYKSSFVANYLHEFDRAIYPMSKITNSLTDDANMNNDYDENRKKIYGGGGGQHHERLADLGVPAMVVLYKSNETKSNYRINPTNNQYTKDVNILSDERFNEMFNDLSALPQKNNTNTKISYNIDETVIIKKNKPKSRKSTNRKKNSENKNTHKNNKK